MSTYQVFLEKRVWILIEVYDQAFKDALPLDVDVITVKHKKSDTEITYICKDQLGVNTTKSPCVNSFSCLTH